MRAPTLWTAQFWKAAAERAAKTAAQVAVLKVGADLTSGGFDVMGTDWAAVASWAAGGAVLSVLTSIGSDAATGDGPSLTNAEHIARHGAGD